MISSHVKITCYFTREGIMLFSQGLRLPLQKIHNLFKSTEMCYCMIETSSVRPRKSSVIVGNLRKMFGNVRLTFGTILENFRKSSENHQKRRFYIIKRTLHVSSKIMYLLTEWEGRTGKYWARGPYVLTGSQIFSHPARPYSVNKHFII